jgi:superfamily II DNA/RNA helicase
MRLGDLCIEMHNRQGYYVSEHGTFVRHNVDAQMTILDVLYAILIETEEELRRHNYAFDQNDVKAFINKLIERRLLIDMPCINNEISKYINSALSDESVVELSSVDNVFMYFKMFNELRSKYGDEIVELTRNLTNEMGNLCFKTAYGELIKLLRYEAPLPSVRGLEESPYKVLEAYILPFLEEPLPEYNKDLSELTKMNNQHHDIIDIIINALKKVRIERLHEYQYNMLNRMFQSFNKPKIAVISAPTASGKTEIFMTYVIFKLLVQGGVVVIIYPTKALARQQLERFISFIYHVNNKASNKTHVYILDGDSPRGSNEVSNKPFRGGIQIRDRDNVGKVKYNSHGEIVIEWNDGKREHIDWLSEFKNIKNLKKPAIVITNYSMLSEHIHRGSSWINDLASSLNTIVIDEAHVFINNKEKSDFMHFLLLRLLLVALLQNKGAINYDNLHNAIKELVQDRKLDIILSSATISDRNILPEGIATTRLGGIDLAKAAKNPQRPPIELLLRGWLMNVYCEGGNYDNCDKIIYESYYDSIGESNRKKLYVTAIYFPEPMGASRTPFIEALATTMIWAEALSRNLGNNLHAIAFVDSKATQYEIFNEFVRRGLEHECFHADKLLVSPVIIRNKSTCPDNKGYQHVERLFNQYNNAQNNSDAYQVLARYSHLQLYYEWSVVEQYMQQKLEQKLVDAATAFATSVYAAAYNYSRNPRNPWINDNNKYYVLVHNADLKKDIRQHVEDILGSNSTWNLVISTSTLELGIDIPGVIAILQFGAPPSGESFVQRVGRGGRDERSFRVAFGAVFARNIGKDIVLIDETEAIKNLFNLTKPGYSPESDNETLTRYMALIYLDNLISINKNKDDIIKAALKLYLKNVNANKILDILNNTKELVENYNKLKEIIKKLQGQLSGSVPYSDVKNKVLNNLRNLQYGLEAIIAQLSNKVINNQTLKLSDQRLQEIKNYIDSLNYYAEKLENIAESFSKASLSKYLHYYVFIIYDLIDSIKNDVINSKTASSIPLIKERLKHISNLIDDLRSSILQTIMSREGLCISSDKLALLLMGMPMPHPAVLSEIGGCVFDINDVEIKNDEIRLKYGEKPKNANRTDILKNVPFKYYGSD